MKYSFNQNKDGVVFANTKDVNASYKDLCAVCDSIRYKTIPQALDALDNVIVNMKPILYRTYNINMGARHELGGRKGRTPIKCAKIVRKVLVNAAANARNKGMEPDFLYVVHAAANKTIIARRFPSKGALYVTGGPSGQVPARHSDLEFARVEIGVAAMEEKKMSKNMVSNIKFTAKKTPKTIIKKKEVKKTADKKEKKQLLKIEKKEPEQQKAPEQKKDMPKQEPPKELTPKEKTEIEHPTEKVVEKANQ
ncbi:MAG: uL22 family ribosomal protein [Candidatus Micrarchaeales archaeon]